MEYDLDFAEEKPCTILIVEDQAADIKLVTDQLLTLWPECKIVPVRSMLAAYKACRAQDFDLVLLDLNLPDGFGPSSVQELRRFNRKTPIVVLTGFVTDITIYETMKRGARHILSKKQVLEDKFFDVMKESIASAS